MSSRYRGHTTAGTFSNFAEEKNPSCAPPPPLARIEPLYHQQSSVLYGPKDTANPALYSFLLLRIAPGKKSSAKVRRAHLEKVPAVACPNIKILNHITLCREFRAFLKKRLSGVALLVYSDACWVTVPNFRSFSALFSPVHNFFIEKFQLLVTKLQLNTKQWLLVDIRRWCQHFMFTRHVCYQVGGLGVLGAKRTNDRFMVPL